MLKARSCRDEISAGSSPEGGIIRLRPVMITVGATVLALFPLALHGGPLCYAQIGGLTVATFITLLMVPVFYSIFVLDLKVLSWETKQHISGSAIPVPANPSTATATSGD
jgi:AcrB/AcrD/AcrF family